MHFSFHTYYEIPFSIVTQQQGATTSNLLDHHPVSPYLDPRSLLISYSPTEPYPPLHHVFVIIYHLNSAPSLYLHHRHCQSHDIIFIRLLYPSPPGLPLKIKISSLRTFLP